ncbi:MAG: Histidinol-phosphate aminotransferase [Firmicutes bacterium]|nr:Histidinol-phosphate aminotransferase [Bacillota bacterium]MDI6705542.1 histidinol-phosphate transaminase [Bacillota bacterium]
MIENLIREEIRGLRAYKEGGINSRFKLDANENGWGLPDSTKASIVESLKDFPYHRYPDSDSTDLRERLSGYTGVKPEHLMIGNGSDELIQYIVQTFIGRGDRVVTQYPTFSMYGFFTKLMGGIPIEVYGDGAFRVDTELIIDTAKAEEAKVVFLCNPNNPTGRAMASEEIRKVLTGVPGVLVVDEAYFEFHGESVIKWIYRYDNLVVLRTFSKAMAIGGLRVGYLAANDSIMKYLTRVKVPYNVGSFSQHAAAKVLEHLESVREWLAAFGEVRDAFIESLSAVDRIKVIPSRANFVLIEVDDAEWLWNRLVEKGILVRKFGDERLRKHLRVTIGTPHENEAFLLEIKRILGGM